MKGLIRSVPIIVALAASPLLAIAQDEGLSVTLTGQETVFGQATAVAVAVDIQPGRCPNRLDVRSKDLLPVALLGSGTFHVTDVDTCSIQLEGVAPIVKLIADVATPLDENSPPCDCTAKGADGYVDLLLEFKTRDIVAALGPVANNDTVMLTLTGKLRDCLGGAPIEGSDCVVIVGAPDTSVVCARVSFSPSFLFLATIDSPSCRQIRCDISRVESYKVRDINAGTVRLNGTVAPVKSEFKGNSSLSVWFLTADVRSWLQPGSVEFVITGQLTNGRPFQGKGSIWVWPGK